MVSKSKIELCHTVPEENVIDFFSIGALSGGGLQASISGTWLLMAFSCLLCRSDKAITFLEQKVWC